MAKVASSAHPLQSYELSKIWARTTPKIPPSPIWLFSGQYIALGQTSPMMPKVDSSAPPVDSYELSKISGRTTPKTFHSS